MELTETASLELIEALLVADLAVQDCVVRLRQDISAKKVAVAYIVQYGQQPCAQLRQHLHTLLAHNSIRLACHFIPLTSVPLTADGKVDEAALARLPVVDEELAFRLAARLSACAGIDMAAGVIDDHAKSLPPLHLADLLPDWTGSEAGVGVAPSKAAAASPAQHYPARTDIPALSYGGDLVLSAVTPRLLVDALARASAQHPENGLVYIQHDGSEISQSYASLYQAAQGIASGLASLGLVPGDRIIFQLDSSQDFMPAFWGCVLAGLVPVPVATAHQYTLQDGAVQKLAKAWQMLHKPVVLASNRIAAELASLAGEPDFAGLSVLSIMQLRQAASSDVSASIHRGHADDPAVILLTSGSTGVPKGVVLSHANLLAMALGTAQQNGFSSQDVTLNWMPLEHVGAVSFLQTMAVVLGCRQVHAPTNYVLHSPLIWLDLIEKHRATITWGPNFAFGLLNGLADSIAKRSWDLSSMRFMVSAAEQIVAKTVRQFLRMLAPHRLASDSIHPAFGMSETCSGITWSNRFSLESTADELRYVELGAPIPSASLRIVDGDNRVLDEGVIGRLQLKGPSITAGYFESPERNATVFTRDGWFDTGDLGFLDQGRLTLTGREKEEIIINGINYAGAEIEAAVEAVAGIEHSYTAAVAVRTAADASDRLAVFFVPGAQHKTSLLELLAAIRQQLGTNVGITPSFLLPLAKADIPKTDIGKIQRKQLRQRFENGEYADVVKSTDVLSENANTLPDWFGQRHWIRKQGQSLAVAKTGTILALVDDVTHAAVLRNKLDSCCEQLICVVPGTGFSRLDTNIFQLKIDDAEGYIKLLADIAVSAPAIKLVLHFWTCAGTADEHAMPTRSRGAERGIFSLLGLLQALDRYRSQAIGNALSLLVFSARSQVVTDADKMDVSKATIGGMLKTAAREFSWLRYRHVDLATPDYITATDIVLQEMTISHADQDVAWRDGQRLVVMLAQADMAAAKAKPLPFVAGGFYLLSGGLGALGVEVARFLLQHYGARLLLLGRTENLDQQRSATLAQLQQLDGEVRYAAADICDREAIATSVAQAESGFNCRLAGVIHLAGSFHQASLLAENADTFRTAVAAKIDGALLLHELLAKRGGGLYISFGSVNGFFGGTGFGAYAAANSFLSGFSRWQNLHTPVRSWCLEWSMWDDMGISHGFAAKEASRAQGFYALSVEQGMHAFRIGLQHGVRQLFIGLDAARPAIRRHIMAEKPQCEWLQSYVTCTANTPAIAEKVRDQVQLTDRFNLPVAYRLSILDEMPVLDTGEPDRDLLYQLHGRQAGKDTRVAPTNDFERRIAAIWQEVLGTGEIGIHDNFFGLGGDSLKGAQVMNRLQEETGVILHIVALFNAPTVAELAVHLGEHYTQAGPDLAAVVRITATDEARLRGMIHPLQPRATGAVAGKRRAIFVLSPPRAGSTLLRVMLGGHASLFAPPELYLLSFNYLAEWRETFSGENTFWHEGMVRALMEIRDIDVQSAEQIINKHISNNTTSQSFFEQIQMWLGERLLVDKTPTYALDTEVLRRMEQDFDDVRYIHLQRHPYGVIRSFDEARLDQLLYAFMPSLRTRGEDQFTRLQFAELIWLICNRNILEFLKNVPGKRQLAVRFEDIVRQPKDTMQSLCRFLDLEFDEAMLQPYDSRRARMTEGLHQQSRMLGDLKFHNYKKIDDAVADSWKREYSVDFLGDVTWSIAKQFGYKSIHDETLSIKSEAARSSKNTLSAEEQLLARIDGMSDEEVTRELEKMLGGGGE